MRLFTTPILILILFNVTIKSHAEDIYLSSDAFIQQAFNGNPPPTKILWLHKNLGKQIETLIDRRYHKLRLRYWQKDSRSAWILEEIGKERYITIGYIIENAKIIDVKVLAYRESRGWEVKQPFFTQQFHNATLNNKQQLSQRIDNITGATLSVRALKKMAQLALLLHNHITIADNAQKSP